MKFKLTHLEGCEPFVESLDSNEYLVENPSVGIYTIKPKMSIIEELIKELEHIKYTKCKTAMEMLFFDGVLPIIEGKYLPKEKELNNDLK